MSNHTIYLSIYLFVCLTICLSIFECGLKFYWLTMILSCKVTTWSLFFKMVPHAVHTRLPWVLQCFDPIGQKVINRRYDVIVWTFLPMNFSAHFSPPPSLSLYIYIYIYILLHLYLFIHLAITVWLSQTLSVRVFVPLSLSLYIYIYIYIYISLPLSIYI